MLNRFGALYFGIIVWNSFNAPLANHLGPSPCVTTKSGTIYGKRIHYKYQEVGAFLGIPYAIPPLGSLRFQKPFPVQPWKQPIYATEFSPACPQFAKELFPWNDNLPNHNEDCLYLNVYVPLRNYSKPYTTMFWIHGGFDTLGSSRMNLYDGRALAVIGNVIIVTINYRLGALGFFYSNSTDASGNMGLYDQILALKWTHENIEHFGGSKDDITIFGESVGAVSVAAFTISPLTRGLYKRAIMESFTIVQFQDGNVVNNFAISEDLSKAVNCANDTITLKDHPHIVVDCLRGVEADTLIKTSYHLHPVSSFTSQMTGDIFPEKPIDSIRNGKFHSSELFIGFNSNEGGSTAAVAPDIFGPFGEKEPKLNKTFASDIVRGLPVKFSADEVIKYYFGDLGEYDYEKITERIFLAVTDIIFLCPGIFFGEKFAKNNDVFFYEYNHRPSNSPWDRTLGVTHFDEVAFVFGEPTRHVQDFSDNEVCLSVRMMKGWSSFAKYGYPGKHWPRFSEQSPLVRVWEIDGFPIKVVPHLRNCNFLKKQIGF